MNWPSVADSSVSNVLAAAAIAAVVWAFSWWRNHRLENKLTESLDANGIGMGFNRETLTGEFSLQVHNYADSTIRIRSVVFIADRFHIELRPREDRRLFQTPLSNEVLRPKFRRRFLSKDTLTDDGNPHAMLLPAKTMAIWEIDPITLAQRKWKLEKIYLAIEYTTLFGNVALIRVEPKQSLVDSIRNTLEPFVSGLYDKRYSDVLKLFEPPFK